MLTSGDVFLRLFVPVPGRHCSVRSRQSLEGLYYHTVVDAVSALRQRWFSSTRATSFSTMGPRHAVVHLHLRADGSATFSPNLLGGRQVADVESVNGYRDQFM